MLSRRTEARIGLLWALDTLSRRAEARAGLLWALDCTLSRRAEPRLTLTLLAGCSLDTEGVLLRPGIGDVPSERPKNDTLAFDGRFDDPRSIGGGESGRSCGVPLGELDTAGLASELHPDAVATSWSNWARPSGPAALMAASVGPRNEGIWGAMRATAQTFFTTRGMSL